jgi:phosphoribosylformimino-5-aminoimidazole carboxamide ribotide isomerase
VSFTVFPAVDITDGKCVRPLQGRFGNEQVYSDDPIKVALGFCRAGARWLHIVDLDGARSGEAANRELVLEVIRSAACPVQAGGGLTTADEVTEVIAAGAGRALLAPAVLQDKPSLGLICNRFGDRIGVSLDVRGSVDGPTVGHGIPLLEAVMELDAAGVSMFVYTDVDRDGSMAGPDVDGLLRLAGVTARPIVASGGISSLDDVRMVARLHDRGIRGACIGRALYENKFGIFEAQHQADEAASDWEPDDYGLR